MRLHRPGTRRWLARPLAWPTSLAAVQAIAGPAHYHIGVIPETFGGLDDGRIAFAYLDLTLYAGTKGALAFVLPRLLPGGALFISGLFRRDDEVVRLGRGR